MPVPIPPSIHSHPDPLLRRLRLTTPQGSEASARSELRDVHVVGFLFGSEVNTTRFGRELYQDVVDLCRRHPHRFKCIYVSIDPTEASYRASTAGKPWLSMVWEDGSSPVDDEQLPEEVHTAHDETFIHNITEAPLSPADSDRPASSSVAQAIDEPPLSRIAIAEMFSVLAVPHLAIYHVPTARVLTPNVKPHSLGPDRRHKTMESWLAGRSTESGDSLLGAKELVHRLRWTLTLALLAISYNLLRHFGGEAFDVDVVCARISLVQLVQKRFFAPVGGDEGQSPVSLNDAIA
ncbi:MAG: hypothetical protein CYPHOPRED_004426 [Cyphobasidiales sp. Tagirdzhanova-0007]|nr:MAG: hypothetical protein CYPHOPRED_004426 [Cyphobasidiales sp. Tagirdzhanova-0007]